MTGPFGSRRLFGAYARRGWPGIWRGLAVSVGFAFCGLLLGMVRGWW
jgi:hypothetical protein